MPGPIYIQKMVNRVSPFLLTLNIAMPKVYVDSSLSKPPHLGATNHYYSDHLRPNPQLLVKRLGARLPPQKLLQDLHLLLGPPALQHRVPIPPALLRVHGIALEDAVEHVCGVDLGGEVAVVTVAQMLAIDGCMMEREFMM